MTAARTVIFAVFGLASGSFLTVVIHRSPRRESVARGRSRCPRCGATVLARDNVPLVSYLLLRGRCRSCGVRISPEYPLTELATAGLFVGASLGFPRVYVAGVLAVFLGVMLALALTDVHHKLIPNSVVYPSLVVFAITVVLGAALGEGLDPIWALVGFASFGGALFVIALLKPGGMGMGDVKLAALIGMVLGSLGLRYVAVAAGVAVLAGGVGGIVALLAGLSRKATLPFGPYLAFGAAVSAFWGPALADLYLSHLGP